MTHRIVFGILFFLLAVVAFATAEGQKRREKKDYRVLQVLGFAALIYAVAVALGMWPQ